MKNKTVCLSLLIVAASCLARAETRSLFNGRDLAGWRIAASGSNTPAQVLENGIVSCPAGDPLNGIIYTNVPPTMNYELSIEAKRVSGSDFFIALTLPIEHSFCTVIIGGWGGGLCGVSRFDYADASQNQWSQYLRLENDRWYTLRVRVTPGVLQVFLDETLYTARIEYDDAYRFSLRPGSIESFVPLGLATYQTHAHWRNFTVTTITELKPGDRPRADDF